MTGREYDLSSAKSRLIGHDANDVGILLDRATDLLEFTGGTLISITYGNALESGFSEHIIVTYETA